MCCITSFCCGPASLAGSWGLKSTTKKPNIVKGLKGLFKGCLYGLVATGHFKGALQTSPKHAKTVDTFFKKGLSLLRHRSTVQVLLCGTQQPLLHLYKSGSTMRVRVQRTSSQSLQFAACTPTKWQLQPPNISNTLNFQSMPIISPWSLPPKDWKDWVRQLLETGNDINWLSILQINPSSLISCNAQKLHLWKHRHNKFVADGWSIADGCENPAVCWSYSHFCWNENWNYWILLTIARLRDTWYCNYCIDLYSMSCPFCDIIRHVPTPILPGKTHGDHQLKTRSSHHSATTTALITSQLQRGWLQNLAPPKGCLKHLETL